MLKESSVAGPLVRAFPPGDQLQGHVNRVRIDQRFARQKSSFPRVRIISDQSGNKNRTRRSSGSVQTSIRNITADLLVFAGDDTDRVPVRRDDGRSPHDERHVPFNVSAFEWSDVDASLVVREALNDTAYSPGTP